MIDSKRSNLDIGWFGPVDGRWLRLLDHFPSVELLDRQTATQWLESPCDDRALLVGLEHRNDPRLAWLLDWDLQYRTNAQVNANTPVEESPVVKKKTSSKKTTSKKQEPKQASSKASLSKQSAGIGPSGLQVSSCSPVMACVLGEDWAGHRRTFPLPESIETFYWHQWYDQIIPWVRWRVERFERPGLGIRIARVLNGSEQFATWMGLQQTKKTLGNRVAWILSDQSHGARMWHDAFESFGIRAIGSGVAPVNWAIRADLVLIDSTSRTGRDATSSECSTSLRELIAQVRNDQPDAFLILIDSFSLMARWDCFWGLGVDAIVDRPFSLQGVLCSWEAWQRSH